MYPILYNFFAMFFILYKNVSLSDHKKKKDIVPVSTQTAKISLFSKYLLFFYLFCENLPQLKSRNSVIILDFLKTKKL